MFYSLDAFYYFYPEDTPLRRLLYRHSCQVMEKSMQILDIRKVKLDCALVEAGALLHDIGVGRCNAPGILCTGDQPYMAHGIIGGEMMREYGRMTGERTEAFARICERHIGAGLSKEDVAREKLPLPHKDFLPETPEEMLVCLADKFFSKSGDMHEKSFAETRASMEKFGEDVVRRFDEMCAVFGIE